MQEAFKQTTLGKLLCQKENKLCNPNYIHINFKRGKKKNVVQPENEAWTTFITEPAEDKNTYKVFQAPSTKAAMAWSSHCYPGKREQSVLGRAVFEDMEW